MCPGLYLRAVREGAGGAAEGDDPLLPQESLWGGQALRLLVSGQLTLARRRQ